MIKNDFSAVVKLIKRPVVNLFIDNESNASFIVYSAETASQLFIYKLRHKADARYKNTSFIVDPDSIPSRDYDLMQVTNMITASENEQIWKHTLTGLVSLVKVSPTTLSSNFSSSVNIKQFLSRHVGQNTTIINAHHVALFTKMLAKLGYSEKKSPAYLKYNILFSTSCLNFLSITVGYNSDRRGTVTDAINNFLHQYGV